MFSRKSLRLSLFYVSGNVCVFFCLCALILPDEFLFLRISFSVHSLSPEKHDCRLLVSMLTGGRTHNVENVAHFHEKHKQLYEITSNRSAPVILDSFFLKVQRCFGPFHALHWLLSRTCHNPTSKMLN